MKAMAAALCLLLGNADSFVLRSPQQVNQGKAFGWNHPYLNVHNDLRHQIRYQQQSTNSHLNSGKHSDEVAPSTITSESIRRRHLLFSLLAASSAGTLASNPLVANAATRSSSTKKNSHNGDDSTTTVLRPPLDDRDYESYTLDNGMRVLLVSDPSTNEAAAAMDVHVGACSDPVEVPGMAHFNEHMLFLGTEKYPEEGSFSEYLSKHGGSSNAFTDSEDTVYYFTLEAESDPIFKEGLLRFGSFFTSPLFTASATGRELNAIESENAKNLQSDIFRSYQIEKTRANPDHPFSKFFTGNKKTLLDDTQKQGIDLREQLIQFYNKYYSSNQMTLAIVAPQSLTEMKQMVNDAFAEVPNRNVDKPEKEWAGILPYNNGKSVIPSFQHVVEVVPVQDLRQVTVTWPFVYMSEGDKQESLLTKSTEYVSHLLGHEGPGSLLSYLKRQRWANSLGSGGNTALSDFESFDVTVELTNQGLANVDNVIEAIFSYIAMLQRDDIPNYTFEEVLRLTELEWRFATKGNPGGYVQSLVTSMQKYPPELYVAGPRRLALVEPNNDKISLTSAPREKFSSNRQRELAKTASKNLVSRLTPENAILTVLSKSFEGQTDQMEKWYGTKYRVRKVSEPTLFKWKHAADPRQLELAYPKPNVFIPTEKGLQVKKKPAPVDKTKKRSFETRMEPIPPPKIIRDDGDEGRWTVHFKQDDRFGQPKAFVIFQLLTSEVYSTAERAAFSQLYQTCAVDHLEEYAYDARLAGMSYNVQVLPRGIRLTFGGYNDKLQDFAAYVAGKLAGDIESVLPQDEDEFERYRDNIKRALSAFDVKQPYAHANYYAGLTQQPLGFSYTNAEQRAAIDKATLPGLVSYVQTLWSKGKGECLVQGNMNEKEAQDFVKTIDAAIGFNTITKEEYPPRVKALPLPPTAAKSIPTRLTVSEPNPSNGNSAAHVILQCIGDTAKEHVLIELIAAILEEPLYEDLRTKQQLGYIVSSGVKAPDTDSRTLTVIVQSSVAPAEKLTTEILKFLDGFQGKYLDPLNEGDVAVYAKSLIDQKTEPDKTLAAETTRNWSQIANGRFQFDRIQREAATLLDIQKQDLVDYWNTLYAGDGRRVLITEVVPRSGAASSSSSATPLPSTGYAQGIVRRGGSKSTIELGIDDIEKFRQDRQETAYRS